MQRLPLTRLRPRASYANVVSTLALFSLLGTGAYAATQIDGATLRDRSVPGTKLARHTVTKTEVAPGFLLGSATIPAGDLGGTYGAPVAKEGKVTRVKDNPHVVDAADPCDQRQTGIFCGRQASSFSYRGWSNWGFSAAFGPVSFWKDPFGLVHLSGEAQKGSAGPLAFILPQGYRPPFTVQFAVASQPSPSCGDCLAHGRAVIQVDPNGDVSALSSGPGYSLDNITFRIG